MKQDLFDWLNSTHTDHTLKHEGTSENITPQLLLAPVSGELHNEPPKPEPPEPQTSHSEEYTYSEPQTPNITPFTEAWQGTFTTEDYTVPAETPTEEHVDTPEQQSPPDVQDDAQEPESPPAPDEAHTSILNQAWHETSGFSINFAEPPQEMWTDIDTDPEDAPKDYEENMSLQGDAYIPVAKHGANFTQRLQATLRGRKAKAAKLRELDAENATRHPYFQKAVIFCGVLLMALGFGYFGLWFIQRETPDGLNRRAANLYAQGRFDEAEALYHRAYTRYPYVLGFLSGKARSAENAGHIQTAIAAWNEYVSSLPKDDTEHRTAAQGELDRLIPGHARKSTQAVPAKPQLPNVRGLTFEEALTEGNNAYNIGMFSRAIANFHKAHAIRENDIRPYIGLAASYRAKGLYFDAKRMLDEARHKFGINPAIDVERYYLRRE